MNRRDALKNLTLSLGYTVATPTIMSMFASCGDKTVTWTPLFLSNEEKHMVTHLVDIIIPVTDTPGALDVNVPQFLDLMYNDIEKESNQNLFKDGAKIFAKKFQLKFNKIISDGNKEEIESLFSEYFNLSDEASETILSEQKLDIDNVPANSMEQYTLYNFLLSVKQYTLFGYFTSEKVGKEILAYDPIPGVYISCAPLDEISNGTAWSL